MTWKNVQAEPQKWNFVEENAAETETGKEKAKDQGDWGFHNLKNFQSLSRLKIGPYI